MNMKKHTFMIFIIITFFLLSSCFYISNSLNGDRYRLNITYELETFGSDNNEYTNDEFKSTIGNVELSPLGDDKTDPPSMIYQDGSIVTLTATPLSGYEFKGWKGDLDDPDTKINGSILEINLNKSKDVVAVFKGIDVAGDFAIIGYAGGNEFTDVRTINLDFTGIVGAVEMRIRNSNGNPFDPSNNDWIEFQNINNYVWELSEQIGIKYVEAEFKNNSGVVVPMSKSIYYDPTLPDVPHVDCTKTGDSIKFSWDSNDLIRIVYDGQTYSMNKDAFECVFIHDPAQTTPEQNYDETNNQENITLILDRGISHNFDIYSVNNIEKHSFLMNSYTVNFHNYDLVEEESFGFIDYPIRGVDMCFDTEDNMYVLNNSSLLGYLVGVYVYNKNDVLVRMWGNVEDSSADGEFKEPWSIAFSDNNTPADTTDDEIFVVDYGNYRIQVFDLNGNFKRKWGSIGTSDGKFYSPRAVHISPDYKVHVLDSGRHDVQIFDLDGTYIEDWGNFSNGVSDIIVTEQYIYIIDNSTTTKGIKAYSRVTKTELASKNQYGPSIFPMTPKNFQSMSKFCIDSAGILYLTNYFYDIGITYHHIVKLTFDGSAFSTGTYWGDSGPYPGQLSRPVSVGCNSKGYIYVANSYENDLTQKFYSDGTYLTVLDNKLSKGYFNDPMGIGIYRSADPENDADDGKFYVADNSNNRIQSFSASGEFRFMWGKDNGIIGNEGTEHGEFDQPRDIEISDSYIFVADSYNNRIQIFDHNSGFIKSLNTGGLNVSYIAADNDDLYYVDGNSQQIKHLQASNDWLSGNNIDFPASTTSLADIELYEHNEIKYLIFIDITNNTIKVSDTSGNIKGTYQADTYDEPFGNNSKSISVFNNYIYLTASTKIYKYSIDYDDTNDEFVIKYITYWNIEEGINGINSDSNYIDVNSYEEVYFTSSSHMLYKYINPNDENVLLDNIYNQQRK